MDRVEKENNYEHAAVVVELNQPNMLSEKRDSAEIAKIEVTNACQFSLEQLVFSDKL